MPAIRVNPPSNAAEEIETLAATGFSLRGIAAHFRCSPPTITTWFEKFPRLAEAFANGRERERQALHSRLYRLAMEDGDKVAAMFLLKARHGYREGDQQEQANRVAITFNLPGALKPEQYVTVNANADSNTSPEAQSVSRALASGTGSV